MGVVVAFCPMRRGELFSTRSTLRLYLQGIHRDSNGNRDAYPVTWSDFIKAIGDTATDTPSTVLGRMEQRHKRQLREEGRVALKRLRKPRRSVQGPVLPGRLWQDAARSGLFVTSSKGTFKQESSITGCLAIVAQYLPSDCAI